MYNVIKLETQLNRINAVMQAVRKQSKTMQKYMRLLHQNKAMTENEIKALCWALNGMKKINITADERAKLHEMIERRQERAITKEQSKFGINWLRKKAFKLNGEARKNCILGYREQAIVKNFSHFKFVGLYDSNEASNSPYRAYVPIWRTYDKKGNYFDYVVISMGLFKEIRFI